MRALFPLLLVALPAFAEVPLSLTASDGSGLVLVALEADAVVEEPLAFTQLKLVFENPQARVIEGQFRITLPRGATVSRFAMKLDDRWQEGEVVEKQAARRAYEDFLHRRQDPALLEQGAANEFTARVFPIPARGTKELILSFSQDLPKSGAPYVLPLKGLPQIKTLRVNVAVNGAAQKIEKTGWVPDKDFTVAVPKSARTGLRSGDLVVARVTPVPEAAAEALGSTLLLVDTSASRALGFAAELELVKRLVAAIATDGSAQLTVAAFDQSIEVVHDGAASAFGDAALKKLKDRKPLGATDLQAALKWAAGAKRKRVVLLADGVATAGAVEGDLLMAAVKSLKAAGVERLDAVGVGGIRDDAGLLKLATAGLPHDGAVLDGDAGAEEVVRRLRLTTQRGLKVAVEGAKFVWPERLDGVQPGDEVLVWAELPAGAPVKVSVGGKPFDVGSALASVERPLLERAVAQARIAALTDRIDRVADGPKEKNALKEQVVALSVKYRVLSAYTALLVLETEADYARFQINRRALADILTVESGRVAVRHRGPETVAANKPPPVAKAPEPPAKEESEARAEKKMRAEPPMKPMSKSKARADEGDNFDQSFGADDEWKGAQKSVRTRDVAPPPGSPTPAATAAAPPPPPRAEPAAAPPSAPAEVESGERARPLEQRRMQTIQVIRGPQGGGGQSGSAPWENGADPYEGQFKKVMDGLKANQAAAALAEAWGWREEQPGDVLALVALGEVLEASGDLARAARAYGSIIDLFPSRADLRRFAGARLERLKDHFGLALAADSYAKAVEQRADHPSGQHLLSMALLKLGQPEQAFVVIEKALASGRGFSSFAGADQILREDLGLCAAAWGKAQPGSKGAIATRLQKSNGIVEDKPSLRFVLDWETDANDVDFHILDSKGGHAFYSARELASGGTLYADITTGYGPECFTIRLPPDRRSYPYKLSAHYYSRGPMGYGMGKLQIIEHDGAGTLKFEERPYVVMVDQAFVNMGVVKR